MHNTNVLTLEDCVTLPLCTEPNSIEIDASSEESFVVWLNAKGFLLVGSDLGNMPARCRDVAQFAFCFECE